MSNDQVPLIKLNDGNSIPVVAFGTGTVLYNKDCKDQVISAISVGFNSLDGAQVYENTKYIGQAIKQAADGKKIYLTNKWGKSGDSDDVNEPRRVLEGMLQELGVKQLDLYLIHFPVVSKKNSLIDQWKVMEQIKKDGLAKSIGVSNFREEDLQAIQDKWEIPPAVNQLEYHPYVAHEPLMKRLRSLMDKHQIKVQAYAPLATLHCAAGGPVDAAVEKVAIDEFKTPAQVLLQWAAQYGGGTVVTTTRNLDRQREQLEAFTKQKPLSDNAVKEITEAAKGKFYRKYLKENIWDHAKP